MQFHRNFCLAAALSAAAALAQTPAELMNEPTVRAALDAAKRNEPEAIEQEIAICQIPAPPFHEEVRGKELKRLFEGLGLHDVRIDAAGNVIGVRPGKGTARIRIWSSPRTSTRYFPKARTSTSQVNSSLSRRTPALATIRTGLAMMLGVIRALNEAHVETPGDHHLRRRRRRLRTRQYHHGVEQLFGETLKGRMSINSSPSTASALWTITNISVGSNRYRVTFKGTSGRRLRRLRHGEPDSGDGPRHR